MTLRDVKAAKTLEALAKACKNASATIDKDVNEIRRNAVSTLAFRLIYETPVDTSRALSNWQVSYGVASSSKLDAYKLGEQGSTKQYSASRAYKQAQSIIRRTPPKIDLYVSHNLSYIHALNAGSSKQQPTVNFIERITREVDVIAQKQLRDYVNGN